MSKWAHPFVNTLQQFHFLSYLLVSSPQSLKWSQLLSARDARGQLGADSGRLTLGTYAWDPPTCLPAAMQLWKLRDLSERRHGNGAGPASRPGGRGNRHGSPAPELPGGGCARRSVAMATTPRSWPRPEGWGRGRGMRARKSPPPSCRAVASAAARKDLKPFPCGGGGGGGGGRPESLHVLAPGS